ncbi:hypothetical protein OH77DRAFT_69102 [Trametes cingulata]|nr:hypothetical protein OH77DRAFT_69102 [Trametes cingulata]
MSQMPTEYLLCHSKCVCSNRTVVIGGDRPMSSFVTLRRVAYTRDGGVSGPCTLDRGRDHYTGLWSMGSPNWDGRGRSYQAIGEVSHTLKAEPLPVPPGVCSTDRLGVAQKHSTQWRREFPLRCMARSHRVTHPAHALPNIKCHRGRAGVQYKGQVFRQYNTRQEVVPEPLTRVLAGQRRLHEAAVSANSNSADNAYVSGTRLRQI